MRLKKMRKAMINCIRQEFIRSWIIEIWKRKNMSRTI